jgi:hypothetical protein
MLLNSVPDTALLVLGFAHAIAHSWYEELLHLYSIHTLGTHGVTPMETGMFGIQKSHAW